MIRSLQIGEATTHPHNLAYVILSKLLQSIRKKFYTLSNLLNVNNAQPELLSYCSAKLERIWLKVKALFRRPLRTFWDFFYAKCEKWKQYLFEANAIRHGISATIRIVLLSANSINTRFRYILHIRSALLKHFTSHQYGSPQDVIRWTTFSSTLVSRTLSTPVIESCSAKK